MISSKNKKAEILEAYFELLDELNELKKVDSVSLLTPRQYQQDFKNRMKIHDYEISELFRHFRIASAYLRTYTRRVSLPNFVK
mgnify:CR=1 FL=1